MSVISFFGWTALYLALIGVCGFAACWLLIKGARRFLPSGKGTDV